MYQAGLLLTDADKCSFCCALCASELLNCSRACSTVAACCEADVQMCCLSGIACSVLEGRCCPFRSLVLRQQWAGDVRV
jgi:hypothetical protein